MIPKEMLWGSRTIPVKGKARNCLEVLESQTLFLTKPSLALNGGGFWLLITSDHFPLHCKGASVHIMVG